MARNRMKMPEDVHRMVDEMARAYDNLEACGFYDTEDETKGDM